jgi:hypothetical protein
LASARRREAPKALIRTLRKRTAAAHRRTQRSLAKGRQWRRQLNELRKRLRASASDRLWGGSRYFTNRAIEAAAGYTVTSRKRASVLNGNTGSDHNIWNVTADAVDFGTFNGADLAHELADLFGIEGYSTGNFNSYFVTHNGHAYRIQILWAVEGHFNHVHLGARRV